MIAMPVASPSIIHAFQFLDNDAFIGGPSAYESMATT